MYIWGRGCWNCHSLKDSSCHVSLCLISHCCVIYLYSVRFLWLVAITYLDLLKTSSSLEYFFFLLSVYAIVSFSEYSDLHLVKLLKFVQHGIYLLPLYQWYAMNILVSARDFSFHSNIKKIWIQSCFIKLEFGIQPWPKISNWRGPNQHLIKLLN